MLTMEPRPAALGVRVCWNSTSAGLQCGNPPGVSLPPPAALGCGDLGRPCQQSRWPQVTSEGERPVLILPPNPLCDWLPHCPPFLPFWALILAPTLTRFRRPRPCIPAEASSCFKSCPLPPKASVITDTHVDSCVPATILAAVHCSLRTALGSLCHPQLQRESS